MKRMKLSQRANWLAALVLSIGMAFGKTTPNQEEPGDWGVLPQGDDGYLFQYLVEDIKRHYAEGRVMARLGDTLAVRYEFNRIAAGLAALEELEDSTVTQEDWDYVQALAGLTTNDFKPFLSPEQQEEIATESFKEQLRFLQPQPAFNGKDTFLVVDDRDGHLPLIINRRVRAMINFLETQRHDEFQKWLNRYALYGDTIKAILREHEVPPELVFQALIESGLNPRAYSYAHAAGPWQFIISTARRYGLKRNWWVDERRDIIKSTHAAALYLRDLYQEFENWYLAMAAYNAGEGRIWRVIYREGHRDFWRMQTISRQTRNYVPMILAAAVIARDPEAYGFTIMESNPWEFDEVVVRRPLDLDRIANAIGVAYKELKALNPELRQGVTPPEGPYVLRVPKGKGPHLEKVLPTLPVSTQKSYVIHRVRRGETLSGIARRYGVSMRSIARANRLRNWHRLRVGQRLRIPGGQLRRATRTSRRQRVVLPEEQYERLVYVVRKGDTLGEIAERYHTRAQYIRRWNGLRRGEYIYPGQRLTIYKRKGQSG